MTSVRRRLQRKGQRMRVVEARKQDAFRAAFGSWPDAAVQNVMTDRNPRFPVAPMGFAFPAITRLVDESLRKAHEVGALPLPLLVGCESLSVHCDFSGEHSGPQYRTLSFLCCAYRPKEFEEAMRSIRARYGLVQPAREIAYKDIRGGVDRAIPEYLEALDRYVPGLLFTLAVPKTEQRLLAPEGALLEEALVMAGMADWKRHVSYKALCVTQVCAYLVALLGHPGQRVLWMPDNDEIVPDSSRGSRSAEVLASFVRAYTPNGAQVLGWAVPFADRTSMVFHDLLSATDLAAGVISEALEREGGRQPSRKSRYEGRHFRDGVAPI